MLHVGGTGFAIQRQAQIVNQFSQLLHLLVQAGQRGGIRDSHPILHGLDLGAQYGERRAQFVRGV